MPLVVPRDALAARTSAVDIAKLMQRMRMVVPAPQPGTSNCAPGHKLYPYLPRNLDSERSIQAWALDTTCVPMARGFVCLTAVADVASGLVLANMVAITLEASHAQRVIERALG